MQHVSPGRLRAALLVLSAALALALPVASAFAADWKQLRADGQLGERYDGFLEARDAAAAGAAAEINAARRELYQRRAAETGAPIGQVGRIYFLENLEQLPPGTWLRLEDGTWTRR